MKNQNSKLKNIDDIGLFLFAFSPLSMKELWLHWVYRKSDEKK